MGDLKLLVTLPEEDYERLIKDEEQTKKELNY